MNLALRRLKVGSKRVLKSERYPLHFEICANSSVFELFRAVPRTRLRVLEGAEDRIHIVGYYDRVESGARARDLEDGARRDVSAAVCRELR